MEIKLYKFSKNIIIYILYLLYLPQLFFLIYLKIISKQHIKIINYHDVSIDSLDNFEEQIRFILKYYQNCDYKKFNNFFESRKKKLKKPLIIFSFDDGLLSHYNLITPILNKYNITGWFFIPTKYIDTYADKSNLLNNFNGNVKTLINEEIIFSDQRHFMNWEEINNLISQEHVIGSHTHDHVRLIDDLPIDFTNDQVIKPKKILKDKVNKNINFFCWVGGEEYSYGKGTYEKVKKHYKYAFSTNFNIIYKDSNKLMLDRTNIETNYSWHYFIFYFSGIYDLFYFYKRNRLKTKLDK